VPNLSAFGDTPLKVAMGMAGVLPIILNCYVGHQSIHGIMAMLRPYSVKEMKAVCAGGLLLLAWLHIAEPRALLVLPVLHHPLHVCLCDHTASRG
jgi:hypothetical protein